MVSSYPIPLYQLKSLKAIHSTVNLLSAKNIILKPGEHVFGKTMLIFPGSEQVPLISHSAAKAESPNNFIV